MTAETIILVFTLAIYLIIIFVFNKARMKYSGGKIGKVINLILVTVSLLFISDYLVFLESYLDSENLNILRSMSRTAGLGFLAYGGGKDSRFINQEKNEKIPPFLFGLNSVLISIIMVLKSLTILSFSRELVWYFST